MVSLRIDGAAPARATLSLQPVRRLSRSGLWMCVGLLALSALLVAWLSARQGNVFAPAFALLESVGLGAAFAAVWKRGKRGERITIDARALEVTAWPGRQRVSYPSGWVRVRLESGAGRQRLLLGSHGRETEIGAFLADEERATLARDLRALLAEVTGSGAE
ncbi:MAG TPA: DUF2244 domain-containing protein [Rhodanobacteraceae bacterium]|nr:DUF2244 domain-containing protein [Rhodanobacteraceae bacterium]